MTTGTPQFIAPSPATVAQSVNSVESQQFRCRSKLHGIKKTVDGIDCIEIRCKEKWCAERGAGLVVLHYFNVDTGELVKTKKFRDPTYRRKVN